MPAIPHVRFVDEDTFDRLHLAEPDQYLFCGSGDTFELVNILSPAFDARLGAKFEVLPAVGFVAMTTQGNIIASPLEGVISAEMDALRGAAARLSVSEEAVSRRAAASGAVGWLESLARLSDSRDESGSAHA